MRHCPHSSLPNILPRHVLLQISFYFSGLSLVCTHRVLFLREVPLCKPDDTERMESVHHRGESGMDPRCQCLYRRLPLIGRLPESLFGNQCLSQLPHDPALTPSIDPSVSLIPPVNASSSYYDGTSRSTLPSSLLRM